MAYTLSLKLTFFRHQSQVKLCHTRILQKVSSLGLNYFSVKFYQTYFYYRPSKYFPLQKHIFVSFLSSHEKQIVLFWYLLETLINSAAKRTSRRILTSMKRKIDFQSSHLGFPIWMIFAAFDLQVYPMLPTKFRVNWPFGSGEEVKNRFSRWQPLQPSWIFNLNIFSIFDL